MREHAAKRGGGVLEGDEAVELGGDRDAVLLALLGRRRRAAAERRLLSS